MAKPSRAPYVAVLTDVAKDESFAMLGDVAGYNRHEALGRMVALWAFCRDRGLRDAPEGCQGYVVSEALVRRYLGPRGVEAILAEGCAELALGERYAEGLIYLVGTSDTVEALRGSHRTAEAGGRARAAATRDEGGRFTDSQSVSETTVVQPSTSRPPPDDQPLASCEPAASSLLLPPSSFLLPPDPEVPDDSGTVVGVVIPDVAWAAADSLRTCVLKAQPTNAIGRDPWGPEHRKGRRRSWAKTFRLLFERDKRTPAELGDVLRFLFHGQSGDAQFVVQSPDALREKWDRIVMQMGRPRAPPRQGAFVEGIRPTNLL